MKILLVDDEQSLVKGLKTSLEFNGFEVDTAYHGSEALDKFNNKQYDFIILDLMLPKIDGMSLCRIIRERSDVPILMLTARDDDLDKITGLETGADDYMTKPFNTMELIARIKAILRRSKKVESGAAAIHSGPITLDRNQQKVIIGNRAIDLTAKEYKLLEVLMLNRGKVFTRENLFETVWGEEGLDTRTIDVHIRNIREKIETDPSSPFFIKTKWGTGYYFRKED